MELNERIRLARTRAGLTQQDVADHFGIKRPTVAQWEAGTHRPDQDRLPELSTVLSVSLDWLLREVGHGPDAPDGKARTKSVAPPVDKFIKSAKVRVFVREWREFMGTRVESAARAAGMDAEGYLAFETYPINFNLGQVAALADEFGIRGDQFWFPPPKAKRKELTTNPARRAAKARA
jgi:transcriptional regulator with XRE-family HTH domain